MKHTLLFAAAALALSACSPAPETSATADAAQAAPSADHGFGPEISAEDFAAHVKVLSSDEFGGRAPGTAGEQMTADYLVAQFQRLGLKPGNGDSWFQDVAMVETTADETTSSATITLGGQARPLAFGTQMALGTRTAEAEVKIDASELVFVGYGVNAPEAGWNDYAGLDVTGKTVVVLVNDPGFHAGDESLFAGKKMTYYGRWTYKFEEAARQGAAAALIVHDDAGAGYGWDVVKNSWSGAQYDLPASADPEPRLPMQGWLTGDVATQLFADAGLDFEAMRAAANKPGFKAVSLGDATFSATLNSTIKESSSRNILAMLPGSTRPDEAIVYTAHWDHLGDHSATHGGDGEDHVYNGAIDNATGVAGVLEIAEAFTVQDPAPERSVVFLLVTLEESGLLGSKYYAANPSIPLKDTVAVVNLDAMSVVGPTKDFVVIGLGNSELDDVLRPIAEAQGRELVEEDGVEKGFFFRSDHFSFAKYGVPALYAKGGIDHVELGKDYGRDVQARYGSIAYHKPADEFDPEWDLRGVVQDLQALYGVGRELAGSEAWPNYVEGNAFKAARDAARAGE
ncbi:M28 family metallopeptidase [Arenimonas caeni]|jgi:Zn-dependent M28 family amino/carboxypeptidase|uniref:M28 family metallopeptidase n=1 Tax=Arenimonas caeni TaxID=2058085 RepID=UPI002A36193D|nr:M28 family metallopeptidase [Arenimonas caeni]MDY0022895.1 M28 family metallopeptidase [Arenimonas caeni]